MDYRQSHIHENGLFKLSPYVFQQHTDMQDLFFDNGDFELTTYKPLAPKELSQQGRTRPTLRKGRCQFEKLSIQ